MIVLYDDPQPFVFHNTLELDNVEDWRMADVMASYWGNFLLQHDPMALVVGTTDIAEWPACTAPGGECGVCGLNVKCVYRWMSGWRHLSLDRV